MSTVSEHRIMHQAYEVVIKDQDKAHEIQSGISLLQETDIKSSLKEILDSFSKPSCIYQFERIELDLGTININNYKTEIRYKVEETLKEYLKRAIISDGSLKEGKKIELYNRKITHLEHYLIYGYFIWGDTSQQSAVNLLQELLENNRDVLRVTLLKIGKKKTIRKRMVYQFKDDILDELVSTVSENESGYIIPYKNQLLLQQKNREIVETGFEAYRNIIWEIVLTYIFTASNGYHNRKNFLGYLIKNTARAYNIGYNYLLTSIFESTQVLNANSTGNEFQKIISELHDAVIHDREGSHKTTKAQYPSDALSLMLSEYIKTGVLPLGVYTYAKWKIQLGIKRILKYGVYPGYHFLKELAQTENRLNKFVKLADREILQLLVAIAPITAFDTALSFFESLEKLKNNTSVKEILLLNALLKEKLYFLICSFRKDQTKNKLIEKILNLLWHESKNKENDLLNLLKQSVDLMPTFLGAFITSFISKKERTQEILKDNHNSLLLIRDDFASFISSNEPETWYYWIKNKIPEWKETTGLTENKILDFLKDYARHHVTDLKIMSIFETLSVPKSKGSDNSFTVGLVEAALIKIPFDQILFTEWCAQASKTLGLLASELHTDTKSLLKIYLKSHKKNNSKNILYKNVRAYQMIIDQEKNVFNNPKKLQESVVQTNFPYVIRNNELPWHNSSYGLQDFNEDFKKNQKITSSLLAVESNLKHLLKDATFISKLTEENLYIFWKIIDKSEGAIDSDLLKYLNINVLDVLQKEGLLNKTSRLRLVKEFSETLLDNSTQTIEKLLLKNLKTLIGDSTIKLKGCINGLVKQNQEQGNLRFQKHLTYIIKELSKTNYTKNNAFSSIAASGVKTQDVNVIRQVISQKESDNTFNDNDLKLRLTDAEYRNALLKKLHPEEVLKFVKNGLSHSTQEEISFSFQLIRGLQTVLDAGTLRKLQNKWLQYALAQSSYGDWVSWDRPNWDEFIKELLKGAGVYQKVSTLVVHSRETEITKAFTREQHKRLCAIFKTDKRSYVESATKKDDSANSYRKLGEELPKEMVNPAFISNSGLVLVAPFLGMLFERCGYMKNGIFESTNKQHEAAKLLNYVVLGEDSREEHIMVLNKVLTGIPITEPLNLQGEILQTHKETADSLLDAVREQWKALSGTSTEGLRTTFLQREGKLEEESEQYNLKVAGGTFDVLLDQIPWSISQVKLSWMPKILITEWR